MFRFFDSPISAPTAKFTVNMTSKPLYNILFGARNGFVQQAAFADTIKAVTSVALANGATGTVWTPGALNVIQLTGFIVAVSVAGAYRLMVNGVNSGDLQFALNTEYNFPIISPGLFLYPVGSSLGIFNNTGGVATVFMIAFGTEVLG